MRKTSKKRIPLLKVMALVVIGISTLPGISPATGSSIDPQADLILRKMSDYLGNLQQFSVHTQNTLEDTLDSGNRVDYEKCVGCGACAKVCPRDIITMAPFKSERMLVVECSNHDAGKDVKAVCKVGCLGCRACERTSGMFTVVNNLSTINYDNYTLENLASGLTAAKKCPRNRLVFVGIPSDKDILAVAGEELPDVIEPDFKTTVDDTEWRG